MNKNLTLVYRVHSSSADLRIWADSMIKSSVPKSERLPWRGISESAGTLLRTVYLGEHSLVDEVD